MSHLAEISAPPLRRLQLLQPLGDGDPRRTAGSPSAFRAPHCLDIEANEQFAPHFSRVSPTRRVPTLVHGDFALAGSTAITEYLAELVPDAGLYPADRQARAKARQVMGWVRSDLMALRKERPTEVVFRGLRCEPLSEDAQDAALKLFALADALLPDGADHLFGQWCLADLDLAITLNRLVIHGDDVPPKLAQYAATQWQRPSGAG